MAWFNLVSMIAVLSWDKAVRKKDKVSKRAAIRLTNGK